MHDDKHPVPEDLTYPPPGDPCANGKCALCNGEMTVEEFWEGVGIQLVQKENA